MNVELLDRKEQVFEVSAPAKTAVEKTPVNEPVAVDVPAEFKSDESSIHTNLDLPVDATNEGSTFETCPNPSVLPETQMARHQKIGDFLQYAKTYPTEPQGIQNLLLYAHNLATVGALTADMKKQVIRGANAAALNSAKRASAKGYQGLRGDKGSAQFLKDALAPFKPVTSTISHAEMAHQTLRAVSGKLLKADSTAAHPGARDMQAQNLNTLDDIGMPASNGLGSSRKKSAPIQHTPISHTPGKTPPLGSTLPAPKLPSTGMEAPPSNFASGSSVGLKGIKDYYVKLLQYLHAHPGDITAMQYLLEFTAKVSNLYGGNIPADVEAILNAGHESGAGALDAIASFIPRLAQYSFFTGYQGQNGKAGLTNYLSDISSAISSASGASSPFMKKMLAEVQKLNNPSYIDQYTAAHTNAKGGLCYTKAMPAMEGQPPYSVTYNWDNSGADPTDVMPPQEYILNIINNQAPDSSTEADPFNVALDGQINTIQASYRVSALQDLLTQYKDPMVAITLWIMQVYDTQYQTQEGGLNETTDDLTQMTNDIATRLSTLAQQIGYTGWNTDPKSPDYGKPSGCKMEDVEAFARTLENGSTLMNSLYQLGGDVASTWNKNVFEDICGIKLTNPKLALGNTNNTVFDPKHFPDTVGQLLFGVAPDTKQPYTADEKAKMLSTMNLAPPPVSPDGKTPDTQPPTALNAGYQEAIGDFQQAGSLITGRSKIVSMQLQQTSDCDSQDIKAWSTMLQDLAQFIMKGPIGGQKQN